jgi:hypothetical protein
MLNRVATLLGTDTGSLAPAAGGVKVHLAIAPFTPSPALVIGGLTEATFVGYAALLAAVGAQQVFTDPLSGQQCIQLVEPLGGWHFNCTGGAGLPQTCYGYYFTDNASAVLWGSALFPSPFVVTATGQSIDIGQVRFLLSQAALI